MVLRNVRHVLEIRLNLLSVSVPDDEGFNNLLGERKWKLLKGRMVVARAQKMRSLYVMNAKVCQEEANMVDNDSSELWHKRLAHMSLKGMEILSKKNFLPDVAGMNLKPYVYCLAGKQHRVAFHTRSPSRRRNTLDLVHTDVCSMDVRSLGGAQYFVTFLGDHSRRVWAFVLKTKILQAFQQFQARVEKCKRSYNGGKYRGPLNGYCKAQGIKLEKTVPKTPQLNGVAERTNRTINERIRCLLSHA